MTDSPPVVRSGIPEPFVNLSEHTPGKIFIEVASPEAMFDPEAEVTYPHSGVMMNNAVVEFLVDSAREQRKVPSFEVTVRSRGPSPGRETEDRLTRQAQAFFANESEIAQRDFRLDRGEGWGSFRYSVPFVLIALALGTPVYIVGVSGLISSVWLGYLIAIVYLVFITIVWVMLWDPIEKILFVAYFSRLRARAFRKLAAARYVFVYPA